MGAAPPGWFGRPKKPVKNGNKFQKASEATPGKSSRIQESFLETEKQIEMG
jgi:hypothetical protein